MVYFTLVERWTIVRSEVQTKKLLGNYSTVNIDASGLPWLQMYTKRYNRMRTLNNEHPRISLWVGALNGQGC
jgi:hypothetical protein